jgi:hypothetical protein
MSGADRERAIKTFKAMAETHVESMQSAFGATLCYDEGSIFLLDDLISRKGITPEDENFHVVIMTVGSYLGETLIRVLGGRWGFDDDLEWVVVVEGEKVSPFMLVIRKFTVAGSPPISEWYEEFKQKVQKGD